MNLLKKFCKWILFSGFLLANCSHSICSMEPFPDIERVAKTVSSKSFLPPSFEPILRAIGALVEDSGPTCFIARCYTGENPQILEEQEHISSFLRLMGIRTILDVNGDRDGLPVGGDTLIYMEKGIAESDFVLCVFTVKGLERYRTRRLSGYAIELRNIFNRLEAASSSSPEKELFLIPVLMSGTKSESIPSEFGHLLFIDAVARPSTQFDLNVFFREMLPLFEQRIFKNHPRFAEIQGHLNEIRKDIVMSVGYPIKPSIPDIAPDHEEMYQKFLKGKLIYTDPRNGKKTEFPFADLSSGDPLEGVFNLSGCDEDTRNYLSIHTGYRKGEIADEIGKYQIWIVPKFVVERDLATSSSADHLRKIMTYWTGPVGVFWTWGGDDLALYDSLISNSFDDIGSENLCEKWSKSRTGTGGTRAGRTLARERVPYAISCFVCELGVPLTPSIPIEDICRRFSNGKLIYTDPSDGKETEFPFADLSSGDPLEGVFNLSGCDEDTRNYLSIHTGYRKGEIADEIGKYQIWIVPKFVVERDLATSSSADHLRKIMTYWTGPVGVFWTWGGDDLALYDSLISNSFDDIGSENLCEKWSKSRTGTGGTRAGGTIARERVPDAISCFICKL